jgi:glutathione S-transferase
MEARFMYTLYIANKNYSSWSLRPWVLMKELGIAFDEQLRRFEPGGAWSSFRTFSPTGKVPTLRDGENTVWDSLAIAEYLAERHAGVWPADAKARAWARCASAEMHSAFATLRQQCSFNLGLRVKLREMPEALKKDVARIDELWSEGLAQFGGPYLAGASFTAVDAFFAPLAFRVQTYGLPLGSRSEAYAKRLLALPSMVAWYEAGLKEDFRDPDHDEVVLKYGDILSDSRVKPA